MNESTTIMAQPLKVLFVEDNPMDTELVLRDLLDAVRRLVGARRIWN